MRALESMLCRYIRKDCRSIFSPGRSQLLKTSIKQQFETGHFAREKQHPGGGWDEGGCPK